VEAGRAPETPPAAWGLTYKSACEKGDEAVPETIRRKGTGKKSPRVSIIIPAYNHEKFIMEALRSVLEQDEQDVEIIVVDDGSTDGTGEILKGVEDERVRVISQPNSGTASAVNRGLSLATGSYVSILNSDDRYRRDRLSTLISELEGSPGSLFAMSRVCLIDGDGRPVRSGPEFEWLANAYRHYEETRDFLASILKDNFTCTSQIASGEDRPLQRPAVRQRPGFSPAGDNLLRIHLLRPRTPRLPYPFRKYHAGAGTRKQGRLHP